MSTDITINGTAISFPEQGTDPDWGDEVNAFAVEVAEVLNNLVSTNDILSTTFLLTNNTSSPANVNGLLFSSSLVRSAKITADVYISTSTTELHEVFEIWVGYENTANQWDISVQSNFDDSGIEFSITSTGQVQYISSNVGGSSYSGTLVFSAKTIPQ